MDQMGKHHISISGIELNPEKEKWLNLLKNLLVRTKIKKR